MTDPARPAKEAIVDQIIHNGLERKTKEIEYLRAKGASREKLLKELLALNAKEDALIAQFNDLAKGTKAKTQ